MTTPRRNSVPSTLETRPDTRLVTDCLKGSQEAWSALIDKYKNLIFSIPLKYGLSSDEAAEIFQWVCVTLLSELPKLRDPKALPAWLIRVTAHQCFQRQRDQQRFVAMGEGEGAPPPLESAPEPARDLVQEIELEQTLREAVASLSPRCRQMMTMLFYESPARPYEEVAASLGLAKGSIGFIRGRCLEQLRKKLERAGFTGS